LKGTALDAVKGIPQTEANYLSVIEVLKKRFGDTSNLLPRHHAALRAIPSIQKANAKELRTF
jgi:hypothetical protein